jgi:hypothetical protein
MINIEIVFDIGWSIHLNYINVCAFVFGVFNNLHPNKLFYVWPWNKFKTLKIKICLVMRVTPYTSKNKLLPKLRS